MTRSYLMKIGSPKDAWRSGLRVERAKACMSDIVTKFDAHRILIFSTVEKYTHLNVFRYDTE